MSAAAAVDVLYGADVADEDTDVWPAAGYALLDELDATRGRVALITAAPADADALLERLRADLGIGVVRIGGAVADRQRPPSEADIEFACGDATAITDIDVLLWPEMSIAPLQLLTARARRRATIAVWPGQIARGRASYSAPGRPDHHDSPLHDVVIMRPRGTRFPDEVPFTIERTLL